MYRSYTSFLPVLPYRGDAGHRRGMEPDKQSTPANSELRDLTPSLICTLCTRWESHLTTTGKSCQFHFLLLLQIESLFSFKPIAGPHRCFQSVCAARVDMAPPMIPLLAGLFLFSHLVYKYLIHPLFFSPLRKIPAAHWSARFTNLWIQYHRSRSVETFVVHAAHEKLGPIVLLGPDCLSVNAVDGGIRTIYSGGWEKGDWYSNAFTNYGIEPMFAMATHNAHAQRKRMVSNVYAKSTLQNSAALSAITDRVLGERLLSCLDEGSKSPQQTMELYDLFCAATMDVVSAYVFGLKNGSNFLQDPTLGQKFFRDYKARQLYQFWPQDAPRTTAILASLGLRWLVVPPWVNKANQDIEAWLLTMCDKAEQTRRELDTQPNHVPNTHDHPTVYLQTHTAMNAAAPSSKPTPTSPPRLTIASELLDHVLAGFDTSSIVLAFLAWELSQPHNAAWQSKLQTELRTLPFLPDPKTLDALPILHAIIMETLRLHAAIPGNQPRISPRAASLAHITHLPAGLRVQSQAWSLHRNATVFPAPDSWRPQRWLDADETQQREMARWFWAFGSGGRMCVGSHLAMHDMKAIVAVIWRGFRTRLVDGRGMVHSGGYEAGPVGTREGRYCVVRVEKVMEG
nr:tryprostatin b 6-hydroxylase [Quercus suber]